MNSAAQSQFESGQRGRSFRLVVFFLLTYAITETCFILVAVDFSSRTLAGRALLLLGTFSPSLVALWLSAREGGKAVEALLGRIFEWRVGLRWYVFAAGYIAVIKLTAAVIDRGRRRGVATLWE